MISKTMRPSFSLSRLHSHIVFMPFAAFLAAQTDVDLQRIAAFCEQHWARAWTGVVAKVGWALGLLTIGAASVALWPLTKGTHSFSELAAILVPLLLVGACIWAVFVEVHSRLKMPDEILQALRPLGEDAFLHHIVAELHLRSERARAYHCAVPLVGRELRMVDLTVMNNEFALEDPKGFRALTRGLDDLRRTVSRAEASAAKAQAQAAYAALHCSA